MKIQNVTVSAEYRRERGSHSIKYGLIEQIEIEDGDVPADVVSEARRRLMQAVHDTVERAIDHVSPPTVGQG